MNKENPNSLLSLLTVHSSPKTILLVEDEPAIVFLESKVLKNNGYKVITAQSAEKAVEIVNNNKSIDLILMDIDLGIGMDGAETAQEILKNRDIPVVFLSSHTEPEFVEKVDKITSYGYILKGSPDTVLIASLKMAFRLHKSNLEIIESESKYKKLFHELEVHQIELEIQNEELILAKEQAEFSSQKYTELYDFAPSGYFTLSKEGRIINLNLCGAQILGKERSNLINSTFGFYISNDTKPIFNLFLEKVFTNKIKEKCEIVLEIKKNLPIYVFIEGIISENDNQCFITMINITDRKLTENMIQARLKLIEFSAHHSLNELLQKTLDEICIITDSPIGFYHFVEPDQKKLFLQEWSTRTLNEYCKAEGKGLHYPLEQAGIWADCVHQQKPVIHNDYASLTHKKGLPEGHAELVRELVVPIMREGLVVAILGIGNKTQDYNEKDIESVTYFADVAWEIAEKKQTEESLKASEERLKRSEYIGKIGNWEYDIVNNTILWSDQVYALFKRNHEEGPPTEVEESFYYSEEVDKRLKSYAQQVIESGEPVKDYEFWIMANDKSSIFLGSMFPVKDENGGVIKIFGTFQDITERKQVEEKLREKETQFRKLSANVPDLIFQFTRRPDGTYYVPIASEGIKNIFGCSPEDVLEDFAPISSVIYPEDAARVINDIEYSAENLTYFNCEFRVQIPGRPIQWIYSRSAPEKLEDGSITWYGFNADITERKRMEEELQKIQKLESLGVLAGGIAHDFNNLIGGIYGYIDIANIKSKDEHTMQYLSKAMNTIDRARDLTRQLLTFAKGGAPIQKVTSLIPFIQETVNFSLSGSDISCRFDIPESLWQCNIDKNQISQVIGNIIINAKQAMPDGGSIDVIAGNISLDEKELLTLKKGNYVKISIKDYGIGISKEIINNIFDPFFTTKEMGHGLGLATCYSIIKRHGGGINVESESDKGTTFHIYLPASVKSGVENGTPVVVKHDGKGTFIVMDDEEVIRDIMKNQLEMLGYYIICTNDGKKAIDFLIKETEANRNISAMILDLTISGGMGGKTAIAEIRKLNTEIPVFVVSGYADDPVIKDPTGYGFTDSLCKPFRISELSKMLNKHLK